MTRRSSKRDRKVLTFVLDRGMEGFVQTKPFRKMGIHSSRTGELFFNNVRLGRDRLLGETEDNASGDGRASARSNFAAERIGVVAMALGVIEECLRLCVDYARTRTLWGKEIGQFQLIQLKLADMEVARMNVRNMLFRVIECGQTGTADLAVRGVGDEVLLLAGRDRCGDGSHPAVRRQRVHDRVPGGTACPRRQVADDLRGKQRGSDHPCGQGAAQRQLVRWTQCRDARRHRRQLTPMSRALALLAAVVAAALVGCGGSARTAPEPGHSGSILHAETLSAPDPAVPADAASVRRITYLSRSGVDDSTTQVTGSVYVPQGSAPAGGFHVVAYGRPVSGTSPRLFAACTLTGHRRAPEGRIRRRGARLSGPGQPVRR